MAVEHPSGEIFMKRRDIVAALFMLPAFTTHARAADGPSDEQRLGVVFVANQAEIAAAQLALRRSGSKGVQAYARRIIAEHGQVQQEIVALTRGAGTQPQRSATSNAMTRQGNADLSRLEDASMYDFDDLYLERETGYLGQLVNTVDDAIRSSGNADVRTLFIRMRPSYILQLDQAQRLKILIGSRGLRR
jgi:putative membrane protein